MSESIEYYINHKIMKEYKKELIMKMKMFSVDNYDVDELQKKGIQLVLNNDEYDSKKAINFVSIMSDTSYQQLFKVFIYKELSQICYGINDVEDSIIDYFGWLTLAIREGVKL
jgi:hypothetical protein